MSGVIGSRGPGTERPARLGPQADRTHQAGDAIFRAGEAAGAQFVSHPGAAVGAGVAVVVDGVHLAEKFLVVSGARARWSSPEGVVSAPGDAERRAQFCEVEQVPHGINQRIPLCLVLREYAQCFF